MRSGKDEERSMGPLFPRLHVNDTEKGGPRAPPRNKMALYEQLSIPSQRFNSGSGSTMPVPQNNACSNLGSPASASLSQGGGHDRTVFSPYYMPPTPAHLAEELHSQSSAGAFLKTVVPDFDGPSANNANSSAGAFLKTVIPDFDGPSAKNANCQTSNAMGRLSPTAECSSFRPRNLSNSKNSCTKKVGDDEDFMVPTFVQSGIAPGFTKDLHNRKCEIPSRPTPGSSTMRAASATCSSSMQLHNTPDKYLKRPNTTDVRSRQHVRNQIEENPKESISNKDQADSNTARPSTTEKIYEPRLYASSNQRHHISPVDDSGRLDEVNEQVHPESAAVMPENNTSSDDVSDEPVVYRENVNVSRVRNESCSRALLGNGHRSSNEYCEDNGLLQVGDADKNDDASENSMVDSISALDISPDDVVGVIGQKHFWKARTAIANQQRLFSVQVFELHRLIKVQKVFAGSPHLLLENNPYLSKPSPKPSPARELPSDYVLKSLPQIVKRKSDSLKPNKTTECTAENAVGKTPLPSVSDIVDRGFVNQHSGYGPYSETPPAAPVVADNQHGWCFPPPGNQWLVPVMSPSEGLIYKPFAGPCPPNAGFMAPIYGGCLPPAYGMPPSHPPGMGLLPTTPVPQNYFPHYRMPVMSPVISSSAVEQVSSFPRAPSHGQTEQLSSRQVNVNLNSRNSCNMSNQKSEALSRRFSKVQPSKESELQGSTASSPCDRAGNVFKSRDALPLFPTAPAEQAQDSTLQTRSSDQQYTRAIKVVPHNPRSANESAARIFRSIQEERQQHD